MLNYKYIKNACYVKKLRLACPNTRVARPKTVQLEIHFRSRFISGHTPFIHNFHTSTKRKIVCYCWFVKNSRQLVSAIILIGKKMRPFDSIKGRFIRDPTWWRKRPDSRACLNASSLSQTGCKTTGVHPLHYYVRRGSRYNTPFLNFKTEIC